MMRIREVTGLKEWYQKLGALDTKIQRKYITDALKAGAKVLEKTAKGLVPQKTGQLKKVLRVKVGRISRTGFKSVYVGENKKWFTGATYYANFQEWGFKHGKKGKANRKHEAGYHFMEHAFDESGKEASEVFKATIIAAIEKVAAGK